MDSTLAPLYALLVALIVVEYKRWRGLQLPEPCGWFGLSVQAQASARYSAIFALLAASFLSFVSFASCAARAIR